MIRCSGNLLSTDLDFFDEEEPDIFVHTGFNSHILNIGDAWQFWECYSCGNATASKPVKCEKCHSIASFIFRRLLGKLRI